MPVDEEKRKSEWIKWWSSKGSKSSSVTNPREVKFPEKDKSLAEFIGIILGDGTVSEYHIAITLNSVSDKEYSVYVKTLIEKLFGLEPKVYFRKNNNVLNIVVARKRLVAFLVRLGLPKGNKLKHGLSIPDWIKDQKDLSQACVRGLMDTDGSVYDHEYSVRGKKYKYKKMSFTSASETLRNDFMQILADNQIKYSCYKNNIRIESNESVTRYMSLFGSSNQKHLKRMQK